MDPQTFVVGNDDEGVRVDAFLAARITTHSRVQLRKAITQGKVLVDGQQVKPSFRVRPGQQIIAEPPEIVEDGPVPEDVPLDILYEDEHFVAVNKPPAMVVHPARGNWSGTLTNALAFHFQQLSDAGGPTRPGIVHRLDRDTSGVILAAKTNTAHYALADKFQTRTVTKTYAAIVAGEPDRDRDRIDQPIGPHPYQREKMAIRAEHPASRSAESFYEVKRRFRGFALLDVTPKTGRTHQIRVHLAHVGCPVLCDRLYGGRATITVGDLLGNSQDTVVLGRQALHARKLEFEHPLTGQALSIEAPMPEDLESTLKILERRRSEY